MAGANFILDKGFLPEAAVTLFQCVKGGTANETVTPVTATGDFVLGVAQEPATAGDVTNGRIINVRIMGITRVIASGAITRYTRVRAHSSGKVIALAGTAGVNEAVVGIAMYTAADADQIDVLLTPGALSNAAIS